jgi:hypothetical protein
MLEERLDSVRDALPEFAFHQAQRDFHPDITPPPVTRLPSSTTRAFPAIAPANRLTATSGRSFAIFAARSLAGQV